MSMNLALEWASRAMQKKEVPVGAVLVSEGTVIASAHNRVEELRVSLAHAEMLVLYAGQRLTGSKYLDMCDLYVTLEPCPLCASALRLSRIRRLYFGAYDPKGGGVEHGPRLLDGTDTEVIGGIQEAACSSLLRQFFAELR